VRPEWVKRAGLVEYLTGRAAKLILVEAPAGFGKSILVAQWRASLGEGRKFAWVTVDSRDNDPVRLWWHIVRSLQRASPALSAQDLIGPLRMQTTDLKESLLPALVNALATLPDPVVLVLDDYHVITDSADHEQLAFLLLNLPPTLQVVLITRADPPLPIGRLRAAGELVEIGMKELRFAATQADLLVEAVCGARLDEADIAVLVERTEGWPAGIYLAALSLRGQPEPSRFVRQFTGGNRFVVEFIAEEVLGRQPYHIQQFLRRTAILDRFTSSLCDEVAGSSNAAAIIATLESENLFLVALDDDRHWYRYHQLFRDVLMSWLIETEPGIVPSLHVRASGWHRRRGSVEEAITHALGAGDNTAAVDVIASSWPGCVDSGQTVVFRAAMDQLGADRILASPVAAHCAAWCAAVSGELSSLRRWLSVIEAVIEAGEHEGRLPDGMRSLRSSAALLRGVHGFDGIQDMRESAAIAVDLETDPASPWYALARTALGAARYVSGEPEASFAVLSHAMRGNMSIGLVRMLVCSVAALVATERGRPGLARELVSTARGIADDSDLGVTPYSTPVYTASGAIAMQLGQFADARDDFERALSNRSRWFGIIPWSTVDAMLRLAQVLQELGDPAAAIGLQGEAEDMLVSLPDGAEAELLFRGEQIKTRVTSRPELQQPTESLTEREQEVLRLLRSTLSLRQIGLELFLSANTVKTHVRAIYRKLGVSTRQEAVERGREASPFEEPSGRRGQMS
jgi:LuxR family maltose regulon positive regulatory protein